MPDAAKWVDWWQKEREIKALESIKVSPSSGPGGTPSSGGHGFGTGCAAVTALLLVIGGCSFLLQRAGCVASEESLRASAQITTAKIEPQPPKNLVWVHFSVKNGSKWPMSVQVGVILSRTTDPAILVQNSVKVLGIPPRSSRDERVAFEASRLGDMGILDPSDKDLCRIEYSIEWIAKTGSEPM